MAIYGDGRAAIALGVVLDNDLGDAPTTYGTPTNIYFADLTGGNPVSTTTHDEYLSAGGSAPGGATIIQAGTVTPPSTPRLGTNLTDSDHATNYGPDANGDNVSGTSPNDEDALPSIPALTPESTSYALSVPATTGAAPAYVTAWVDFNRNGSFEASEFASATVPANSTSNVALSWPTIPPGTITPGTTYIRLRISTFDSTDPSNDLPGTPFDDRSTMALNNGEIEEYALPVAAPQPAFACTSTSEGYLFQDATTDVFVVNIETGATNQVATDILGTTGNTQINAIGYNRTDNYIWGFRRGVNEIVRVGADWSVQTFPIAGLPVDGDFFIGDVDAAGVLYLYNSAAYTTSIYRVDVNPASPTYLQTLPTLTTTASGITDWAISPSDNQIYAVDNATLALYRFDPATGARTVVGTVTGGGITAGTFGAAYMDGDGALFISQNETGNIYKISAPHSGNTTAVFLATGPTSTLNDGARCPAGSLASLSLSGTIHHDPDGGNINGTGTNAGGALHVSLVDENGDVKATQPVAADGTYTFGDLAAGSYTVVLSTTAGTIGSPAPAASLPSGYVSTNEGLTPAGDGTVDGTISATISTTDVTDVDFAIEQLPVATPDTRPAQSNPGGTTTVDITSSFTGTDPDGTVTGIFFPTFPSNATTVLINGTSYTAGSFPAGGLTVPIGTPVLIDPVDGAVTSVIPFHTIDNAGQRSIAPADVTVPFTDAPGYNLSGTVFNDTDGGDISGIGTNVSDSLYANLADNLGNVVAVEPVATLGTYTFPNVAPGDYTVVLSTTQGTVGGPVPAASLPAGYVNTNEGLMPAGDGTVDGVVAVTVTDADVTNVDFAIQRPPVSVPVTLPSQQNPGGTNTVDISAHFTGTDPDGTVTSLRFRTFPNETTTLIVDGTPYNAGNFPPPPGVTVPYGSPVLIDPVDAATSVVVPFSLLDNAGHESPTSDVTIPFFPLPVTLARFDAVLSEQSVLLTWSTTEETNSDHFEIQHSVNGKTWEVVGTVASSRESSVLVHYEYKHSGPSAGDNLYRLRMVDQDGTYAFSSIRNVRFSGQAQIISYPNPATDKIKLRVSKAEDIERIELTGLDGRVVADQRKTRDSRVNTELDIRALASGVYIIRITYSNGSVASDKIVKK